MVQSGIAIDGILSVRQFQYVFHCSMVLSFVTNSNKWISILGIIKHASTATNLQIPVVPVTYTSWSSDFVSYCEHLYM